MAAAGAAEEDRALVLDQLAAATGEDGRPIGETRPVLVAPAGRERSDAALVRGDGATHRDVAGADWIGCGGGEANKGRKEGGRRVV